MTPISLWQSKRDNDIRVMKNKSDSLWHDFFAIGRVSFISTAFKDKILKQNNNTDDI